MQAQPTCTLIESVISLVEGVDKVLVDVLADGDLDDWSRTRLATTVQVLNALNARLA
jgi:hypothetical protein